MSEMRGDDSTRSEDPGTEWLYIHRGETHGPVSSAELRAAAHLGFVSPEDLVRQKDRSEWMVARLLRGLFKEAG